MCKRWNNPHDLVPTTTTTTTMGSHRFIPMPTPNLVLQVQGHPRRTKVRQLCHGPPVTPSRQRHDDDGAKQPHWHLRRPHDNHYHRYLYQQHNLQTYQNNPYRPVHPDQVVVVNRMRPVSRSATRPTIQSIPSKTTRSNLTIIMVYRYPRVDHQCGRPFRLRTIVISIQHQQPPPSKNIEYKSREQG